MICEGQLNPHPPVSTTETREETRTNKLMKHGIDLKRTPLYVRGIRNVIVIGVNNYYKTLLRLYVSNYTMATCT